jgi:polyisoprenoid-binding protein YceI
MADTPDTPDTSPAPARGFPRLLKWGLIGALAILVVGYGAIFVYAKVINDSPDPLDADDLGAALDSSTTDARPAAGQDSTPAEDATGTTGATGTPDGAGVWNITQASELGYRIKEVLFGVDAEAVGRTDQISGSFTIYGTQVTDGAFVVDVAAITSDDSRRDGQFRNRIMSTDEFPTATFTLTAPIELGVESAEGAEVDTAATGDLTLRGVTNSVTFDVTARQADGKIGVLGNIPVVFADYSIANPSTSGISTEDHGLLVFVLVFEPA